jgi:preprotein translocase subunit SecG
VSFVIFVVGVLMDVFPIILVIHLLIAIGLVGVILLQRSEGGALGIGGGTGGGLMSGRAAGNLLTRTTGILATTFFVTSLVLAIIANNRSTGASPFDSVPATVPSAAPTAPAAPAEPAAPLAR